MFPLCFTVFLITLQASIHASEAPLLKVRKRFVCAALVLALVSAILFSQSIFAQVTSSDLELKAKSLLSVLDK